MVESKLVELVVAGSNPVGHPMFVFNDLQNKHHVNSPIFPRALGVYRYFGLRDLGTIISGELSVSRQKSVQINGKEMAALSALTSRFAIL